MIIIKGDGSNVEFDPMKIRASLERTGAEQSTIDRVTDKVEDQVRDGMTTKQIYDIVHKELKKENTCIACRYNLRGAILRFGPTGFLFEQYVASILRAHGYEAQVPDGEFEGACVRHEIDGVAEKNGKRIMIEAKFRRKYHDNVNLKDTMATWSRFVDLVDGAAAGKGPHFDEVWIVTNAKFSDRAYKFGTCKGMKMIGWNLPKEKSFASMVDEEKLYPITVLDELSNEEIEDLSIAGTTLCKELIETPADELSERTGIHPGRTEEIVKMCQVVVEG